MPYANYKGADQPAHPHSLISAFVVHCLGSVIPLLELNDHLFGKELFILFAASAFRKLSSIYVFSYFPFGFEGRIWDLIVSVPDHCLSFYFAIAEISRP